MEGFKPFKKVQCFKEGGSVQKEVNFTKRDRKVVDSADIAQDKKIVKKAFSIHDSQQHEEKTDLKGLKKGGRTKKEVGTVKKYKTGGAVENAYGAKKTDKDIKDIANSKRQKPALLCGGKSVNKYADGGGVLETLKNNIMGTPAQNAAASQKEQAYLKAKMAQKAAGAKLGAGEEMAMGLAGLGQKLQPAAPVPAPYKKGGKVKKHADGGSIDDDVRSRAMKWIESGSPEQPVIETPKPKSKTRGKRAAAKLSLPDYSNEDLDRMGLNEDTPKKATPRFNPASELGAGPVAKVPEYARAATGYKRGGKACK